MKNFRNKLPMIFSLVMIFLLTSCKVDWSTVSAIETNKFASGLFWVLVQIIVPVLLWIIILLVFEQLNGGNGDVLPNEILILLGYIGVYVFHFWHLNVEWFNLLCITEVALSFVTCLLFKLDELDDSTLFKITNTIASIGIMIVSLLANVYTGRFLEPFVFSCAGWLTILLGSISRIIRDDDEIGMEILAPILCLAAMIFGVVNVDVPNLLYFISILCGIVVVVSSFLNLTEYEHVLGFIILILGYVWVFVSGNLYNSEKFGKSLLMCLIPWGVIALIFVIICVIGAIVSAKKQEKIAKIEAEKKAKAAAAAKIKAEQEAKARAEAEAKAAEEAKIKAEEAKIKAEQEAKARAEAEAKAKAEAEAKAAKLVENQNALEKLEAELASKKAEVAALGMDAQGIIQKGKLNKEVKELESQIENLKSEIEKLK